VCAKAPTPIDDGKCPQAIDKEGFAGGVMMAGVSGSCAEAEEAPHPPVFFIYL